MHSSGSLYSMVTEMSTRKWSQKVTEQSNALELEKGVFTWNDPQKIAASLIRSALNSTRRKATVYQSAMLMLNFYINRAGKNLSPERKEVLNQAKKKLSDFVKNDI